MNRTKEFHYFLKVNRAGMSRTRRALKKDPKHPTYIYPVATELQYAKEVGQLHRMFAERVLADVAARLRFWIEQKSKRNDSFPSDYNAFVKDMEEELLVLYGVTFSDLSLSHDLIISIFKRISAQNRVQWNRQLKTILGIDWFSAPEDLLGLQEGWYISHHQAMKEQAKSFLSRVLLYLASAMAAGITYEETLVYIKKLAASFTGARAYLLARDQIGILNSLLWQSRFAEINMPYYIWHTSMDERVRGNPVGRYPKAIPSHWAMEGLLMRWDNPRVYSDDKGKTWKPKTAIMEPLHVGMAIACRCVSLPYWADKIAAVDAEIERGV